MSHVHTDTDIDLALTDPGDEPETVYERSGWGRLVNTAAPIAGLFAVLAAVGDYIDQQQLYYGALATSVLLMVVTGFALVMEYRHDNTAPITIDDQEV